MALEIHGPGGSLSARTRIAEAEMFQIAARAAAETANSPSSIEKIMRLALKAQTEAVRLWAKRWLQENFGVSVSG